MAFAGATNMEDSVRLEDIVAEFARDRKETRAALREAAQTRKETEQILKELAQARKKTELGIEGLALVRYADGEAGPQNTRYGRCVRG